MAVLLETSLGDIVIDLYTEERPRCCLNFLKLCKIKFYNFCLFHSIQRDFLAQTGDPNGTGQGGDSIWGRLKGEDYKMFEAEVAPRIKHKKLGTVSMVDNGNGHHTSQFFITLMENLSYLDGKHTVFGEVAEGFDVLRSMNEAYCDKDGRPFQDIRIYHTVILDDPFPDPDGLVEPGRSPSPPEEVSDSNRIGAEEDIDEFKGKSEEEVREIMGQREAHANAQILEMVGDIPDADAKPPENVLFVCKLNPATTAEDLEIIFSRFGPIVTCEVIKDQKTGDSLQYAFIEFENEEDCTSAYFKMENVLIDDRRVHVDFCQSLAKVKGIRRRKLSSEKIEKGFDDRLVSRVPAKQEKYEMVFDRVDGGDPQKRGREREESRHKRKRDEVGRERRREERERDGDRRNRREKERREDRRQCHRSRSRSRERSRHHKHRQRSRSRDRH